MASKQSAAVVELYQRWLTVPATDQEWTPQDDRLLLPHSFQMMAGRAPEADDAIARLAGWLRPKLGA
jgi:hypothetical protein